MECASCGSALREGARFCPSCGTVATPAAPAGATSEAPEVGPAKLPPLPPAKAPVAILADEPMVVGPAPGPAAAPAAAPSRAPWIAASVIAVVAAIAIATMAVVLITRDDTSGTEDVATTQNVPTTDPAPATTSTPSTAPPTTAPATDGLGNSEVIDASVIELANQYNDALVARDWDFVQAVDPGLAQLSIDQLNRDYADLVEQFVIPVSFDGRALRVGLLANQTGGGFDHSRLYCLTWLMSVSPATVDNIGPEPPQRQESVSALAHVRPEEIEADVLANC